MSKPKFLNRRSGLLLLLALGLAGVWWFLAARPASLDRIAQRLDAGEVRQAVIELKSILQSEPESGAARLLLGRALTRAGDPTSALAEFDRALAAGLSADEVAPAQSAAMLAAGNEQALISKLGMVRPASAAAAAELLSNLAMAHAKLGDLEAALSAVKLALQTLPEHPAATVLQARLAAAKGDTAAALAEIERVIAREPRFAGAWVAKADLLRARPGDHADALAAYRRALELDPSQTATHADMLALLVKRADFAEARKQWKLMAKVNPGNGLTQYFDALLALREGEAGRAREVLQRLMKSGAAPAPVLALAGQADAILGFMSQAEAHFSKAVSLAPAAAEPRQQWAALLLRQGKPLRAIEVLAPVLGAKSTDSVALLLSAQAHLALGEFARADAAFDRAAKLAPTDLSLKTVQAQAALSMGRAEQGMGLLETLAASDPGLTADLALISARLNRRELDQAAKAVEALGLKQPKSAMVDELRGRIALLRNDRAAARGHFEKALQKAPNNALSVQQLALLDLADKQPKAARERYESLVKADPLNASAWLGLLELQGSSEPGAQVELMDKAVRANPASPLLRRAQIDLFARQGDHEAALSAARAAASALSDDPNILERLAQAQLAAGDRQQGLANLRKLASTQAGSAETQLRVAAALSAAGEPAQASERVQAALRIAPESTAAQLAAIGLALRQGEPAKALAIAVAIQTREPAEAVGYSAAGDIESQQGHWDAAAAAYAKALTKARSNNVAPAFHNSLIQARRYTEARRFEADWLKSHPADINYRLFLAERAVRDKDVAKAQAQLRHVIQASPAHAGAHNNLANLLHAQQLPEALVLAERAVALAPKVSAFRDTLASILADSKQLDRAVEVQRSAVELAPDNDAVRLNLARLYIRKGELPGARDELTAISRHAGATPQKTQALALLKELGPSLAAVPGDPEVRKPSARRSTEPDSRIDRTMLAAIGSLVLSVAAMALVAKTAVSPPLWRIVRTARFDVPSHLIYAALQDFTRWESWSPWAPFGVASTRRYSGAAQGLGHRCDWSFEGTARKGSVEVLRAVEPSQLILEWRDDVREEAPKRHELNLSTAGESTTELQWVLVMPAPFWPRLMGVLSRRPARLGRQLDEAMGRLRWVVEAEDRSAAGLRQMAAVDQRLAA